MMINEFQFAYENEEDIANQAFHDEETTLNFSRMTISKCEFKNCKCIGSILDHAFISDVKFINCDFSNSDFSDSSFTDVEFIDCKFFGCKFLNNSQRRVKIENSNFSYSNYDSSNFKKVDFISSKLDFFVLSLCKLDKVSFKESSLVASTLVGTSLNGIDVRDSSIEGIVVKVEDIKGLIVNEWQALELAKLLELDIR